MFLASYTPPHFFSSAFAAATMKPSSWLSVPQGVRLPGGYALTRLQAAGETRCIMKFKVLPSSIYFKASLSHLHFLVYDYQQGWREGEGKGGHFQQCDIYKNGMLSLAWPWFTFSSGFRFPEHVYIDLSIGPILDAKSQLSFSFCYQKMDFFPTAKSENSGLSFC